MLAATKVLIQGKRLWVEVSEAERQPIVDYIDYHAQNGLGHHMQFKADLPETEPVTTERITNDA